MPKNFLSPSDFGQLARSETLRRNLRKTPEERVETLMSALRYTAARGWWPVIDRRVKEQRLLCSIREKLSPSSTSAKSVTS
jgi:hypothetical protein